MKCSNDSCTYFAEYMRVKGLKPGDYADQVDYMSWITGYHNAFQKLTGRIDS
jgi:hypothetical protein